MNGTPACLFPTVDCEGDSWLKEFPRRSLGEVLGITRASSGVNKPPKAAVIQMSDSVPESTYELLAVFTASRKAEMLRRMCACVERLRPVASRDDEHICCRRSISTTPFYTICIEQRSFPVNRRLLGWAGRIRGAWGWGPGRSSNGELCSTELQDQLGQGQIFLARGVWVLCNVSLSSLRWAKMKCNRKGNAQVVRCPISVR